MTKRSINLVLGIHNHQPYGNFDQVLEHACERCYLPFLQVLERHPKIKFSVHFTGFLLEWIAGRYPEILSALRRLVARAQVELVTGGYYEPILATIPDTDKIGQVRKLTDYIYKLFERDGKQPDVEGMWLAERVWEPHLPRCLAIAGVKYVCLDDSHFKGVGMPEQELLRSYITEEQGHTLEIFPINEKLRYIIPFDQPSKAIDYLKSVATESGDRGAFYFDDGEKFGIWPGTYDTVYTNKWLDKFFEAVEENLDWINVQTFGEYRRRVNAAGMVYLPTASYMEMLEWSLPADRAELLEEARKNVEPKYASFLRGGFWRYFMVRYPEVNNLHKKMLHVSKQLEQTAAATGSDTAALAEVRDKLWSAQSNDAYWHGVFGGVYLTNLRTANYQALVEAESKLDSLRHSSEAAHWLETETADLDCDGKDEVAVKTELFGYYIAPSYGGALFELDYKPRPFNLIDTLARRPEAYHSKIKRKDDAGSPESEAASELMVKEADLDRYLVYDWHRRLCFLDHFLDTATTLEGMSRNQYGEKGDFVNQPYELMSVAKVGTKVEVGLQRKGNVWNGDSPTPLTVAKTYSFDGASETAKVLYTLTNPNDYETTLWFAPEFNFNFLAPDAHDRYYFDPSSGKRYTSPSLNSQAQIQQASSTAIADEWLGVELALAWSQAGNFWRYPVYTVSNSEAGFERVFQGSCLIPNWQINLAGGQSWQVEFQLSVRSR
jgi:alpha-amylase